MLFLMASAPNVYFGLVKQEQNNQSWKQRSTQDGLKLSRSQLINNDFNFSAKLPAMLLQFARLLRAQLTTTKCQIATVILDMRHCAQFLLLKHELIHTFTRFWKLKELPSWAGKGISIILKTWQFRIPTVNELRLWIYATTGQAFEV